MNHIDMVRKELGPEPMSAPKIAKACGLETHVAYHALAVLYDEGVAAIVRSFPRGGRPVTLWIERIAS